MLEYTWDSETICEMKSWQKSFIVTNILKTSLACHGHVYMSSNLADTGPWKFKVGLRDNRGCIDIPTYINHYDKINCLYFHWNI